MDEVAQSLVILYEVRDRSIDLITHYVNLEMQKAGSGILLSFSNFFVHLSIDRIICFECIA